MWFAPLCILCVLACGVLGNFYLVSVYGSSFGLWTLWLFWIGTFLCAWGFILVLLTAYSDPGIVTRHQVLETKEAYDECLALFPDE
jgi:hypothetical protein